MLSYRSGKDQSVSHFAKGQKKLPDAASSRVPLCTTASAPLLGAALRPGCVPAQQAQPSRSRPSPAGGELQPRQLRPAGLRSLRAHLLHKEYSPSESTKTVNKAVRGKDLLLESSEAAVVPALVPRHCGSSETHCTFPPSSSNTEPISNGLFLTPFLIVTSQMHKFCWIL